MKRTELKYESCALFFHIFIFWRKNFDSVDFSGENLKLLLPPIQPDLGTYINFFFLLKPERFSAKKWGGERRNDVSFKEEEEEETKEEDQSPENETHT
jgi:hypothetical protein